MALVARTRSRLAKSIRTRSRLAQSIRRNFNSLIFSFFCLPSCRFLMNSLLSPGRAALMAHYRAAVLAVSPHAALTFQGWFWKDQRDRDADLPGDVGRGAEISPASFSLFLAVSELSCGPDSWPCSPPSPGPLPLEPLSSGGF